MTLSHEADIYCGYCGARGDVWTDDGLLCVHCFEENEGLVSEVA